MKNIKVGQKFKRTGNWATGVTNKDIATVTYLLEDGGVRYEYADGFSTVDNPDVFLPDEETFVNSGRHNGFVFVEDLPPEVQYRELPDWGAAYKITSLGTDDDGEMQYEVLVKNQNQNKTWGTTWIGEDNIEATEPITKEEFDNFLPVEEKSENDPVSPNVYQFPTCEVRDISAHLTSFGGQATQYIARSTRLDGVVKDDPVQDLRKAIQLLEWEIERIEDNK